MDRLRRLRRGAMQVKLRGGKDYLTTTFHWGGGRKEGVAGPSAYGTAGAGVKGGGE